MMRKMKSFMAMMLLVGLLGVGNAFAQGSIPPAKPRPVSVYTVGTLFGEMFDYFADLFAADAEQTNDAGIIVHGKR